MKKKVCAVVVTFNRLTLLKECIDSLKKQTYHDMDVVVVNNGSTDGTGDYLESDNEIKKIHQDNLGGAGGFYSGMKYGYEHGYDAVWMMDDDGICDENELKNLVEYSDKYNLDVANALVVSKEDNTKLYDGSEISKCINKDVEVIIGKTRAFNGTYISRAVMDRIGYVNKDLFIYGDDRDYIARVDKYGFRRGTVVNAIHYHPVFKGGVKWLIPGLRFCKIFEKTGKFEPFFYRNLGYLYSEYGIKSFFKYWLYYVSRFNFKQVKMITNFFKEGKKRVFELNNTII